ncbi:MAG: putative Zn-dependent peptidase [Bacteroidia bacterium]
MEYQVHTFSNNIRLVYKQSFHTRIVHSGIFIDTGSRDEKANEVGLAHLLEHMLFKGTQKRNPHQVINRLEVVGGDLNAYTTKDKTCVYASVVKEHFGRAIELLVDVTFNSTFPTKELAKEKKVIYEEIDMYLDSPDEKIFDEFQELFYPNHTLGNNILGSKETVASFSTQNLNDFIFNNYFGNEILMVVVAPISFNQVLKTCSRYLEALPTKTGKKIRTAPSIAPVFTEIKNDSFSQAHVLMGGNAFALNHDKRHVLMLLSNLLGGPGMNSLLNLQLREKHGYTYGVECAYQALTDTGLVSIYWSTDPKNLTKSRKAIDTTLYKLIDKELTPAQLKKYKTQFKGQMVMAEESNSSMMFVLGRSLLDIGTVDSLEHILSRIDAVTATDLREVAEEVLNPAMMSTLIYHPG